MLDVVVEIFANAALIHKLCKNLDLLHKIRYTVSKNLVHINHKIQLQTMAASVTQDPG